jgi:ketosteroid isomerase-like protein
VLRFIRNFIVGSLACLPVWMSVVRAEPIAPADAVRAMVEAERQFYQTGQEQGTRAAFLTFLADDAVVLQPSPANGKEAWSKRPENGLDLIWEPTFAAIAQSADFGYTTGPAKWKASKQDKQFLGYGHFVSIWKRQKEGTWKVALDVGIENPAPAGGTDSLQLHLPEQDAGTKTNPSVRLRPLSATKSAFIDAARRDFTEALLGSASDDVRVYRDGALPAVGKDATARLLGPQRRKMSMAALGGDISTTADLAYSYGKYSTDLGAASEQGIYFQIWRIDARDAWKLVLELEKALPPETKPAS